MRIVKRDAHTALTGRKIGLAATSLASLPPRSSGSSGRGPRPVGTGRRPPAAAAAAGPPGYRPSEAKRRNPSTDGPEVAAGLAASLPCLIHRLSQPISRALSRLTVPSAR